MSKLSILKQKTKRDVDMTQGSIFRHLITFAFPLLIGNIFQQLYNTVDTWVVGNYVSNEAFSAVGTVGPVINMLIGIFLGLSSGAGVVISQYYGAKRYDKVRDTVHTSIVMTLILAVLFTIIGIAMIPFVLNFMKTPAEVMPESSAYLTIYFAGVIGLMLYNMGAGILRAVGDSKRPFYFLVVSAVLNIILDLVFVLSLGMGVEGVAWPSVLSRVVAAALILRKCYHKETGNVLRVPKTLRLDAGLSRRILGIGIPSAFENSLFEAGRILVVSMISTFGTVQIAANAVANNLDGMGVIPGKAISLAMITVVGRCIGAGDHEQAIYYTRKLLLWAYLTMSLSNGAILLFVKPLVGIYELSGATMELAILLVQIHAGCALFLWPTSFVLPNALRAANDVKFTMVVSILSMAFWRLGFSYLICVRMGLGAVGVWIAMVVDWVCRVTCFAARFHSGAWKTKYQA